MIQLNFHQTFPPTLVYIGRILELAIRSKQRPMTKEEISKAENKLLRMMSFKLYAEVPTMKVMKHLKEVVTLVIEEDTGDEETSLIEEEIIITKVTKQPKELVFPHYEALEDEVTFQCAEEVAVISITEVTEDVENTEGVTEVMNPEEDTMKRETQTMTTHPHQAEVMMIGAKNELRAQKELLNYLTEA